MNTRTRWTYPATLDAIALRRKGMNYASIAVAVEHYHGVDTTPDAVRKMCRAAGCPPVQHGRRGLNLIKTEVAA